MVVIFYNCYYIYYILLYIPYKIFDPKPRKTIVKQLVLQRPPRKPRFTAAYLPYLTALDAAPLEALLPCPGRREIYLREIVCGYVVLYKYRCHLDVC